MGLSSAGIGSGLDVDGLVSKLMAAESTPLTNFDNKKSDYQNKMAALAKISAAIGTFQGALSSLSSSSTFKALSAKSGDSDILTGSAGDTAVAGTYNVKVNQLAQAQSLTTAGKASLSALIGSGATTTLNFQFGTVSGGSFGIAGSALGAGITASGIAAGSLSINGTAIATDGTTKSAKALAAAINLDTGDTGVRATAGQTATAGNLFAGFGAVATTGAGDSYQLFVGGVQVAAASGAGGAVNAADIDTALTGTNATTTALASAGITFSGSAAAGTLQFFAADGSNLTVSEEVAGSVTGGIHNGGTANVGSTLTATAGVTLTSTAGTAITVGGSNPALAGLSPGSGGSYLGASFAQDGTQASGSVTIDSSNASLQGIRDAINKANLGVTATIVSDGSANPYHLVLTSNKTGASSTMKIGVAGDAGGNPPDPAIAALLGYDPGGAQGLTQTTAAQSAQLSVNGIAVSSNSNSVSDAIQGVSLNLAETGSTTFSVSRNTSAVSDAVNAFIKAYNTLNSTIAGMTSYDPATKKAGVLQGDTTVRSIQTQLRAMLGKAVTGASDSLSNMSQLGIAFQKDGTLALDSSKFNKALTNNFADVGRLFAAIGNADDGLISVANTSAKTQPGSYAVNITQMATHGALTGSAALAPTTTIAANTTWTVTLNQTDPATASKVQNIALTAGTYTPTQLAAMLQAAINGNSTFAGAGDTVEASVDPSGKLSLASTRYGSTSNISLAGVTGSAVSDLFGTGTPAAGLDVAGTIGGVAATGSGQTLSAAAGSAAEGMQLKINGGSTGDRGNVSFSQGYAYQLNNLATSFIGTKGLIPSKTEGLNVTIDSIQKQRDDFSDYLTKVEKRYRAQFTALDTSLTSMQGTANYLTQQLAALSKSS